MSENTNTKAVTDSNYKPEPGHVGNLTPQQQAALDKFRKELTDEDHLVSVRMDDPTLLRFLRARKFDVEKAEIMIVACENWRKDFAGVGIDKFFEDFEFGEQAEVDKYYPQYYHSTDKEGRPLYIESLGKLNIDALYKITTQKRLIERLVFEYEKFLRERLPACSAAVGHPVETSCTILDLGGVSLRSFYRVKDYVMEATRIGQDRYPETMGKFFIINAPWGFSTIYSLIKPWLDDVTAKKIEILGSGYKSKLLQHIDAENLPKEFQGTCECPGGCSLSDKGPWNPPKGAGKGEKAGPVSIGVVKYVDSAVASDMILDK